MYDHTLKVDNEYLLESYDITGGDTTSSSLYLGGSQGGIEIQAIVAESLQFDDLTIEVEHSDDDSSFSTLATLYDNTGNTDATEDADAVLERFTLPQDCKPYVRVAVTVAAGDSGKLTVYPAYVAR